MKLYHTSDCVIQTPELRRGRKNADFGQGFYLTPDWDFALRWASQEAVINEYEWDETGLLIQHFTRSVEWFRYIFENRRGHDLIQADAVNGPIANDTIFDTLGIISSGFLKPEEALKLLLIGPEYIQIAIKTEKALFHLRWTGFTRIERPAANRAEVERYQEAFAEAMSEIAKEED